MADDFPPCLLDDEFLCMLDDEYDPPGFRRKLGDPEIKFDALKISGPTPLAVTHQERPPVSAAPSGPATWPVAADTGAAAGGHVTPLAPPHAPAMPSPAPGLHEPAPLYRTSPSLQELIAGRWHAPSGSRAPSAPPRTGLLAQAGAAAPREPGVAATGDSCPGPSTGGRKRPRGASSSAVRQVKKMKKWQQTTPCEDADEERKRLNAIKSRADRVRKSNKVKAMEDLILSLQRQNQALTQELERVRQELSEEKHKHLTPEEKNVEIKREILRRNQTMMEENQILSKLLQVKLMT